MSPRFPRIGWWLVAAVVLNSMATSCTKPADTRLPKLASDLQLFVTGRPVSDKNPVPELKDEQAARAFIDDLMKEKMGGRLAKDVVVTPTTPLKDRHPIPTSYILKKKGSGDDAIYYLRESCEASDAVKVKPWWDEDGREIQICRGDYKPEVKGDNEGRTCGASVLDPRDSPVCGCGPMLIYCLENRKQFDRLQDQLVQEVVDTVAHVVDKDLPLETMFTMNETVANEASEYLYRRARVLAGEPVESLFPIPEKERRGLRARHEQIPGQHAGILTTPFMMYASDALRGVMRNFYDYLWCSGVSRSNVETEAILALKKVDLRVGDGWKDLASMNVCTECHARLDYGMQFFWGYPSSTMGIDFRPSQARTGKGPMYGADIKDERGQAELSPSGFAKLALDQPEFGACMTRKIVDHVFNGTESAEDVESVSATFQKTHRVKAMLRTALERYATRELKGGAQEPASVVPPEAQKSADGKILLPASLKQRLKEHCKECHGRDDPLPLVVDALGSDEIANLLDQVAFGAMPKTVEGIPELERRAFIVELAGLIFPNAAERDQAIRYHTSMLRAAPVHRYSTAMRAAADRGKAAADVRPTSTESAVAQSLLDYSPGIGLAQAAVAASVCKDKGDKAAREACIERATALDAVVVGIP